MKEFSSYVNFSQIENATFHFFMDQLLDEKTEAAKDLSKKRQDENAIYPINKNNGQINEYTRAFVNQMNCKDYVGMPKKDFYQDTLREKKVSEFLRKRDLVKLESENFRRSVVQSEVELFRQFKLCDLEFTRYAF